MASVNRKLVVGVLMGGTSSEREVSLRSGAAVAEALVKLGHTVVPVDIQSETGRELDGLNLDVAFVALHGRFGEDGGVQAILEQRKIPYTGSGPKVSELAMDKLNSKRRFREKGVQTPSFDLIWRGDTRETLEQRARGLGYPVILKPRAEGSSVGVTLHRDSGTLEAGAAECLGKEPVGLMEKYIEGRELTVGILDGQALPIIELRPKAEFFDYDAKYSDPNTRYILKPPMTLAEERRVLRTAISAYEAIGCEGMGRVDVILTPFCSVHVLEVNTIPGLTERSLFPKAAWSEGIDLSQLCRRVVDAALRDRRGSYWAAAVGA